MAIDDIFSDPVVQHLQAEWLSKAGCNLSVLRLDLIHPDISGNKWFKLKENINEARLQNKNTLLTFGGIWSNHLVATAAATKFSALKSIGIVRGYSEIEEPTETLKRCKAFGMQLLGISRENYRKKHDSDFFENMQHLYPGSLIVPEGGNNPAGRVGAAEIAKWIPSDVDYVALSVGTGTTFSGIRNALAQHVGMLGFAPFKQIKEQEDEIERFCRDVPVRCRTLYPDNVWGGFGKFDQRLINFMNEFFDQCKIPLDIVYTAKMMYYLKLKIQSNMFPKGAKILAIHSGGLQGNYSVKDLLHY